MTSGNGDEKHEVNYIIEEDFVIPSKKILCFTPLLAEEMTARLVRHLFQVTSTVPVLILANEQPRTHGAARILASHFGLCRVALVSELGGRMDVSLDNKALLLYLANQPEEVIILVLESYRLITFLHLFVRQAWDIRVPQKDQGVLIDPTTKRIIPI